MNYVNRKQKQMNMKQKAAKLSLTINNISSVKGGIRVLSEILESYEPPNPPKGGLVH